MNENSIEKMNSKIILLYVSNENITEIYIMQPMVENVILMKYRVNSGNAVSLPQIKHSRTEWLICFLAHEIVRPREA